MSLTLGIGDIPSPQLKVPMTIETWKSNNGPMLHEVKCKKYEIFYKIILDVLHLVSRNHINYKKKKST